MGNFQAITIVAARPGATHSRRPGARAALLALAGVGGGFGFAADAEASAFFVREQSAAAMGNAFAGATAGAEDVTYMFYNGAALGHIDGSQAAGVTTYVLSSAKFRDGEATTVQGVPVAGSEGGRNAGTASLIPALYAVWDVSDAVEALHGIRLGLAVNAPFGFETDYQADWIGRYQAVHSRIQSLAFNPVLAVDPLEDLTLAIGLQAQQLDAKLTNAVDFGTIGAVSGVPGAQPTRQDGFSKLVGDDWGFGWTAGVLYEPEPGTRFGVGYRSAIRHEIRGDARLQLDDAGIGAAVGAQGGTTKAKAKLTTPDVVSFGAHYEIDDAWAVMAEATWTRWSRFRTLRVKFDGSGQPDDVTEQDWRDTWFLAVGGSWRPAEDWTLRSGVAYDQSPARNKTRTPRTPINNGIMLAIGAEYRVLPQLSIAAGYSHFFIESAQLGLRADAPGNTFRGNLDGSSDNHVDTLSVQAVWRF